MGQKFSSVFSWSSSSSSPTTAHDIEEEAIRLFVERLVKEKNASGRHKSPIACLPDVMEKEIYRRIVVVLIQFLQQSLDTVEIHLLDHVITMSIRPAIASSSLEKTNE